MLTDRDAVASGLSERDGAFAAYARACDARDARFDGVFFVAIVTTGIYCRPVCPARISHGSRRRFFASAALAERAGFRPCLRCRPELAPGRSTVDAVSRLARLAERRIAAGALNDASVAELAGAFGVSERHLRRAVARELGVSPVELAQTHRLLLAKRLLADTTLPVTQIAFASGFQSLRRFNAAFRAAYRMSPSAIRRPTGDTRARIGARPPRASRRPPPSEPADTLVPLTLAYRPPLALSPLLDLLARDAIEGVEHVRDGRYARTARIGAHCGIVVVDGESGDGAAARASARDRRARARCLRVRVSATLAPVLMPLLSRLRHLFDSDAEPTLVDAHLSAAGLDAQVRRRPGVRVPGAIDGFDLALRIVLRGHAWPERWRAPGRDVAARVARAIGEPIETGIPELSRLAPGAERIAEAGPERLIALGVPRRRAERAIALARLVADERLRLEPGADPAAVRAALADVAGIDAGLVSVILLRTLGWPDAFPLRDPTLQRIARASGLGTLDAWAERWRPWGAYAALHLWLDADARGEADAMRRRAADG